MFLITTFENFEEKMVVLCITNQLFCPLPIEIGIIVFSDHPFSCKGSQLQTDFIHVHTIYVGRIGYYYGRNDW